VVILRSRNEVKLVAKDIQGELVLKVNVLNVRDPPEAEVDIVFRDLISDRFHFPYGVVQPVRSARMVAFTPVTCSS